MADVGDSQGKNYIHSLSETNSPAPGILKFYVVFLSIFIQIRRVKTNQLDRQVPLKEERK